MTTHLMLLNTTQDGVGQQEFVNWFRILKLFLGVGRFWGRCDYFSLKITKAMHIKSIIPTTLPFFHKKTYALTGFEPVPSILQA
jgi:hypothetical protein